MANHLTIKIIQLFRGRQVQTAEADGAAWRMHRYAPHSLCAILFCKTVTMTKLPKPPNPTQLLHELEHAEELKRQTVAGQLLDPQLVLLRTWQCERLARTYADLLADPQYGPACHFFLDDIYAPRDFSQRDHDAERIHGYLSRVMPAQMLQVLTDVIALNHLTNALDRELLRALVVKLGVTDTITPQLYAQGYRLCDNYEARANQIDLIVRLLKEVGEGAHLLVVGAAMKMLRGPAHRAGWSELYEFLGRAYAAFKQMRSVDKFVQMVKQRETRILDRIFASDPDPFAT